MSKLSWNRIPAAVLLLMAVTSPGWAGTSQADLAITKTDGTTTATPGGQLTYTIAATNNGPLNVVAATVADTFPAALQNCTWTCVASAGSSCTGAGAGNIADSVNLLVSGTATYTATCDIDAAATGTLSNTATVTGPAGIPDPTSGNNSATDADTVLVPMTDLAITKTDSADPVALGEAYSYTVQVSNAGPSVATGVVVTDTLPTGVTLVSTTGCAEDPTGVPTCTLGTLAPSGMASYTINVTAPATAGPATNTATVAAATTDPNTANNTATEETTARVEADLAITKTDGVTTATPGGSLTYTIVAANAGPNDVTGATVADTFPADLTCTWTCTPTGSASCTANGSGNISDTVDIPNGDSVTFAATCTIDPAATGTLSNTATVSSAAFDPNTGNESATDNDTVLDPEADLSITKTDSADPVALGAAYSYTVQVSNAGPSTATGVVVTDTLPAGVTLVSTTGCAEDPAGVPTCTLGTLAPSGMASYTINVTAPATAGPVTNTATVAAATTDPDTGNNTATEETTARIEADLSITKTDGVTTATPGGALTYTIVAANAGPNDVTGATVADTFPADLGCTWTCTPTGSASCTANGSGDISDTVDIPNGDSVTFAATCTIDPAATGTLSNTATISSAAFDPNTGNESATDNDTVLTPETDLSITKTDSADPVALGAAYSYTVQVSNAGPSAATGVVVTDTLPTGVTLVSTTGCAEDPAGVPTCTLGNLTPGGMASYTINVTAPATAGPVTNTATVTAATTDPDTGNNTATEETTARVEADLSITKTDGVTTASPGGSLTYTIVAANAGPNDVTGATVADTFPADLTCTWTCTPTGSASCTANGSGNISDTVDIPNGDSVTFAASCTIDPTATGTLSNTATVSSAAFDPNTGNESATDNDTVLTPEADLSITKTDSADPVNIGASYTYTIEVSNAGPSDATGVAVTDTLPVGVTLVGTTGCAEDPNGVPTCTLGTIAAGSMASYTIDVTAPATAGTVTNTATVSATTTDPNPANDTATEDTVVEATEADISIMVDVAPTTVTSSMPFTVTVTVDNAGPADATGVAVASVVPPELIVDGTVGCAEDPNGVPTCTLGTVSPGMPVVFTIEGTAGEPGDFTIDFTATADNDPNPANNTTTGPITVTPLSVIPTLGEWGLLLLMLLLATAAVLVLHRQRRA